MTHESRHRWIIDSVEENTAAIEVDGQHVFFVPLFMLPAAAREGDVLTVSHRRENAESHLVIVVDEDAKRAALERSRQQAESHAGSDSGGRVVL